MKSLTWIVWLLVHRTSAQLGVWNKVGESVAGISASISGTNPTSGAGLGQILVAGNPFVNNSAGEVAVYRAGGSTEEARYSGENSGDQFGASVDADKGTEAFIVGAPGADGGNGAVYVFDYSEFLDQWRRVAPGKIALPDSSGGVTNAAFGTSVAMSDENNAIACAENQGRCYPLKNMELQNLPGAFEWQLGQNSTSGLIANTGFGNAVDASSGTVIIGAATESYVQFLVKNDLNEWEYSWDTKLLTGFDVSQRCGASVAMEASNWAAYGCPGYGNNSEGRIVVVQARTRVTLASLDGEGGNGLGGSVAIQGDCSSRCVVTTVADGLKVRKYEWVPDTETWTLLTEDLSTAAGVRVSATTGDTDTFRTLVSSGGFIDVFDVTFPEGGNGGAENPSGGENTSFAHSAAFMPALLLSWFVYSSALGSL